MSDYLTTRRHRVATELDFSDEILLVGAGEPISIPGGADQTYRFIPHAEYRYLADRATPGAIVAFDGESWVDFLPPVAEAERVWEGRMPFEWGEARPLDELSGWLAARRGRPVVNLGAALPGVPSDASRVAAVRDRLMHARRPKDAVELDRMRRAIAATAAGFARAREFIKPGNTERRVQIELEAEFFRNGADRTSFDTIVCSGPNSAVLHFSPGSRKIQGGELVLIDSGGEIEGYAADVTRTFGADGPPPAGFPADLYAVVLKAQKAAIDRCRPGAEFRDIHLAAARDMAAGLVDLGMLRGAVDELIERDAHALFFPHGLGHLVGLGVRDASGYLPGRQRSKRFGLAYLRMDLPLEVGYVTTIEPGLYFIPALLQEPERRRAYADAVNWAKVDTLLHIGGIRIEDNILITSGGPENLTAAIPK